MPGPKNLQLCVIAINCFHGILSQTLLTHSPEKLPIQIMAIDNVIVVRVLPECAICASGYGDLGGLDIWCQTMEKTFRADLFNQRWWYLMTSTLHIVNALV